MTFRIRPAIPADASHLPGIERRSGVLFRQWPGLEWIADDTVQSEERHRSLIADGVAFVAADDDGGLVGFLNGAEAADALHLWQIAVDPDHQRRGLGRALIGAAEQAAAARRIRALTLTTFRDVPWNEPYYRTLGFVTLDRASLCPWLTAVLEAEGRAGLPAALRCAMRKRIGDPGTV
ncbi:GNAT family N-acetyltransferase [Roseospira marina]|uniref:GNAT family N-acetyltransferase n=2 Tax=Roseospira marina TaxID=140057 RepID=A0A5M6IA99_9PROT|nr:GNAT family N-acetyltransferase [Roseospira marina]KAA5604649.1 GNAT family N-acetyltransferase [Roseospira marina]MBB4315092.1 GNAT superfamily N-acetyltransferase [Roseospira marina]